MDTSALAAIFFREPAAPLVLAALRTHERATLVISAWTLTEFASVGRIKARTGAVTDAERTQAMAMFQRFVSAKLMTVEVDPSDFRSAAALIERAGALRAGDGLHLAVAQRLSAKLATLDRRFLDAAPGCGVPVVALGS